MLAIWMFHSPEILRAQFSPGELAASHEHLEGINRCTECHALGKKIAGEKCLDCHTLIRTRVERQKGFHGSSEVRSKECIQCHTDHKGRSFDMIQWNGGRSGFNHDQTGYILEGKHRTNKCDICHTSAFIGDPDVIRRSSEGLSLSRTFLGLDKDCRRCHFDEHRKQFAQACSQCHTFEDWKNTEKFDHSATRFPLLGKHSLAACVQCHALMSDPLKKPNGQMDDAYMKLTGIRFDQCSACHQDPHGGKLGLNCQKCHVPGGWHNVTVSGFDHSKTNYPLTGKHLSVSCEKCHQPDIKKPAVYKNVPHGACRDCHSEVHAGQFSGRPDKGRCETCHTTAGFLPSLFSNVQHDQLKFSLSGAHSAVACNQCHIKLSARAFNERTGTSVNPVTPTTVFHFVSLRCTACHTDVHNGQFKEKIDARGCESCHQADSWTALVFDHTKDSAFPLKNKHKDVPCVRCHPSADGKASDRKYKLNSAFCETCHADVHYGQFAKSAGHPRTSCEACHNEAGFKPAQFDHSTSRFSLTGTHQKVECSKCHKTVTLKNGVKTVAYKPIETKCSSCHANLN